MRPAARTFHRFRHREAVFRICSARYGVVTSEIVRQRAVLEDYIRRQPDFLTSYEPVVVHEEAPEVARRMAAAAARVGVGPMAAVAGAMAQLAAEAGRAAGATDTVVDNGGDVYLDIDRPIVIGLFAGEDGPAGRLGFSVPPERAPLALCSSSGRMGHSDSLGACDLATVMAHDAALADAAATRAANLVRRPEDVDRALEIIAGVDGVLGALVVQGGHIGLIGDLPELVKTK